ncbi:MAG TPA: hypothetical protein ENJ01_09335 [Gammaproteobacteria bacterium]|nr:hypothetical protein [Gammaproteobacteria bacterium]
MRAMLIIFFTGLLAVSGCSTTDPVNMMGYATRAYERAVRWGNLESAERFRREPADNWTPAIRERLGRVKVTGYEVINSTLEPDERHMSQTVRIKYYYDADLVERTLRDEQRWEYDPEIKQWFLVSELPTFP